MLFRRLAVLLSLCPLLSACAFVWDDAQGQRHEIGLFWRTQGAPGAEAGAQGLRVRTVGAALLHTGQGSGLSLGYSDLRFLALRNHALVRLPLAAEAAASSASSPE